MLGVLGLQLTLLSPFGQSDSNRAYSAASAIRKRIPIQYMEWQIARRGYAQGPPDGPRSSGVIGEWMNSQELWLWRSLTSDI